MAQKNYYIHVELRDYSDRPVGTSSATCGHDICTESLLDAIDTAARTLLTHNLAVRAEQKHAAGFPTTSK